ncbi:DUF4097 family beta strand repeat-containing protein [Rugosimonospora acidiphila]|uniref:DUF4097 family beta strand repeat-containing protein n=1 Tax=Rugosimonospora acidiphila TaxID=556531 RepID=A0ABP9SQ54_9ACTN
MPTYATPAPITAVIELVAGDVRIIASDRADTVVTVRPHDESKEFDVKTAATTRVDYADGKLLVKSPKPLQVYLTSKSTAVDVTVELPTGSHLRGTTAQGDLICEGRLGDCTFRTYDGDIVVHEAHHVRLTTVNGRITADRITGDARVTGSGEVRLTEIGGAAHVKNLNGPSWIGQAAGDIHVNSAHGDIIVDRPGQRIVARTASGSVRLYELTHGEAVLQTASGEVEIGIRQGSAAWLDVRSSNGQVHNELDTTAGPERTEETVQVRARTLDGDILIRRAA